MRGERLFRVVRLLPCAIPVLPLLLFPASPALGDVGCDDCHIANLRTHSDANENPTTHDTVHQIATVYVVGCDDCHSNDGPSHPDHDNGTVNFGGNLTPALNYTSSGFGNPSCGFANDCHDDDPGDWVVGGLGPDACTDCHGAAGKLLFSPPASGLHMVTPTVSGETHDDSFDGGTADCETCHTGTPSTSHITGVLSGVQANFALDVGYGDGAPETCAPGGSLASCHDDGGGWVRKWSTTAASSDGRECDNCHGDFTGGFTLGVVPRHNDPQVESSHGGCSTCHAFEPGDSTFYDIAVDHRDGNISINQTGTGFTDNGTHVGCANCHSAFDFAAGYPDNTHEFQDSSTSGDFGRWVRVDTGGGPCFDCECCHISNGADHAPGQGKNETLHDAHAFSDYVSGCTDCHAHNGPGSPGDAVHHDGTVDFGGVYTPSALNYFTGGNFNDAACFSLNGCHDADTGEWLAGNLDATVNDGCADCHLSTGKLLSAIPSSGLHMVTPTVSGETHDDSFAGGTADCETCHTATPSTDHVTGTLAESEATFAPDVGFADGTPETCTPGGSLASCHDDGGGWARLWSLDAANSDGRECGVCHGDFDNGWVDGVSAKHEFNPLLVATHWSGDDCRFCHFITPDDPVEFDTFHRSGEILLSPWFTWVDDGSSVGCSGCHPALLPPHAFERTWYGGGHSRWGRLIYPFAPGCMDVDRDGFSIGDGCGPVDCRDGDPAVNPGAVELCGDGVDNDCDGTTDCPDGRVTLDLDGDGKPDLFWRNEVSGADWVWFMEGTAVTGVAELPVVPAPWQVGGLADFDGDGDPDLLWRDPVSGANYLWYLDGTAFDGGASLPSAGPSWQIGAVSDFDGDGDPDLLWRDQTSGTNYLWYLKGTAVSGGDPLPSAGPAWVVGGSADFDGDGDPDLLWRDPATGVNHLWYLDGTAVSGSAPFPSAPPGWSIEGTPDFDGDGRADICWRNYTPGGGENYIWYMNGITQGGGDPLPSVGDLDWRIEY